MQNRKIASVGKKKEKKGIPDENIQAKPGDTEGSVPDHFNKANITTEKVTEFFVFPVHIKVNSYTILQSFFFFCILVP